MSDKVYSYVVMGMITGEHYIEDLKLRVPYRTPMPITENDFLSSKDLNRAVQQNLVKVVAQASIPTPAAPSQVNVQGLERRIESLQSTLAESVAARKELEETMAAKLAAQEGQLAAILQAIRNIPASQTVVQGTNGQPVPKQSDVVGGEVPMFIPEHTPLGTDARIQMTLGEGQADLGEAARKLRELRKQQGG